MSIRDGIRDSLHAIARPLTASGPAPRTLESSALLGPVDPAEPLAVGSPWADSSALNTVVWSELLSDSAIAFPMARADAMAVPAVARSRGMLCTTLGRLDLIPVDKLTGAERPDTDEARFLEQPDPAQPRYITVLWTVDDLVFHGVSWWQATAWYASGRVKNARRILPGYVELPKRSGDWPKVYGRPVNPAHLIRIDGPHEGILASASGTLRAARDLELSAARFAKNPVPAIELHQTDDYPMTPAAIDELVGKWAKARAGANGGVSYTPRNIEVRVHGAPAEHLLTHGRNAAAVDVARHVGTPADSIDASVEHASMTYQTSEGRNRVLIDYGLAAYGAAITARLSMPDITPRGTLAAFRYELITEATDATEGTPAPSPGTAPAALAPSPEVTE